MRRVFYVSIKGMGHKSAHAKLHILSRLNPGCIVSQIMPVHKINPFLWCGFIRRYRVHYTVKNPVQCLYLLLVNLQTINSKMLVCVLKLQTINSKVFVCLLVKLQTSNSKVFACFLVVNICFVLKHTKLVKLKTLLLRKTKFLSVYQYRVNNKGRERRETKRRGT